jgi:hypothetical protein
MLVVDTGSGYSEYPFTGFDQLALKVHLALLEHPDLPPEVFFRLENLIQPVIVEARGILLDRVLPIAQPSTWDKMKVILFMGAALDMQTGVDDRIHDKPVNGWPPSVRQRLDILSVPDDEKKLWLKVEKYYNPTKHRDKPMHVSLLGDLTTVQGKQIAVEYFEAVRRILEWYYRDQQAQPIPELAPIRYEDYGFAF